MNMRFRLALRSELDRLLQILKGPYDRTRQRDRPEYSIENRRCKVTG